MSGHTLRARIHGGYLDIRVECHARAGADCRRLCTGCDDRVSSHDGRQLVDVGACVGAAWINDSGPHTCYAGPDGLPLTDGMLIVVEHRYWGWTWRPAIGSVVNIHVAKTHLSQLVREVEQGNEVVIARDGRPAARLVPLAPEPVAAAPGGVVR